MFISSKTDVKSDTYAYKLIQHVESCIRAAMDDKSNLSQDILMYEGMSGQKTRHLYNNICTLKFDNRETRYLEIGTWKGSSLLASVYNNRHVHATVIDNWSQFNGPKDAFLGAVSSLLPSTQIVNVVEADCFATDLVKNGKFDIYLYDGDHSKESHHKAMTYYKDVMNDDGTIVIVDDWNWDDVRNGTFAGIKEANLSIKYHYEIKHTDDNSHSLQPTAFTHFWNGIGIFVLVR